MQLAGAPFDILYRIDTAVWIYDIDHSKIVHANDAACAIWSAASERELCERDFDLDMSSTVRQRLKQYQVDFLETDATFTELWTLYPNGVPTSVMVIYSGYRLKDGRMGMQCEVVGQSDDTPENLRSAEALLHTDVMIMLFSLSGPSLYMNPAARNVIPSLRAQLNDLIVEPADRDRILQDVSDTGDCRTVTKLNTTNGVKWFDVSLRSCSDAATGDPALLMTAIDVSDLKEARDTARHLADRDQLTNLNNRSYLQNHLGWIAESKTAEELTVVMFDVDKFKTINDRHGHVAGDVVLRQVAARARAVLPPQHLLARFGGDEFVIIISEKIEDGTFARLMDAIRRAIAKPIQYDQTRLSVTVSMGVAQVKNINGGAISSEDLMRDADIALYASKQNGRDKLTYFNAKMREAVMARDRLERELHAAVEREEFVLHFQPRLDLQTGEINGAEGLVRWEHPEKGTRMPGAFISVCEETGLIDELGLIVLELGISQAIEWNSSGKNLNVSLNVSPRQFSDPLFIDCLQEFANRPGFPVGKVELEITESVLIGDHGAIAEKLRLITEMGFEIAIDDFGTGYSNLSYISRFPLTCLKIDKSFISQLPDTGPIVQLILTLGKQIGATVVSEGVETQDQLDWLTEHECEEVQGFLITRALPVDEFEAFVADFSMSKKDKKVLI